MSKHTVEKFAVDLLWSLWTELGVPGVIRHHSGVVLDLEWLILATPAIAGADPRLIEQAFLWCAQMSAHVSGTRLQGLLAALPPGARKEFLAFSNALQPHLRSAWPADPSVPAMGGTASLKVLDVHADRPALLGLRARGLSGVGVRADVLVHMLANRTSWYSASSLAFIGYTKRSVARVLSDLTQAGLLRSRKTANVLEYQLCKPDALRALLDDGGLAFPNWRSIFEWVLILVELLHKTDSPAGVRRVEAHKVRERLSALSELLGMEAPPQTKGDAEAWDRLMEWGADQLSRLADGSSSVLGVSRIKAAASADGAAAWVMVHVNGLNQAHTERRLKHPEQYAEGVRLLMHTPAVDDWMAYSLVFDPALPNEQLRAKVEHLLTPMKVSWSADKSGQTS